MVVFTYANIPINTIFYVYIRQYKKNTIEQKDQVYVDFNKSKIDVLRNWLVGSIKNATFINALINDKSSIGKNITIYIQVLI